MGTARPLILGVIGLCVIGSAIADAASPRNGARIVETTPGGYTLAVSVSASGKAGHLTLSCPDGHSLGASPQFAISGGRFEATRMLAGERIFRFSGRFDHSTHVRGSGSVRTGVCGGGTPASFSEAGVGVARMLSCPASSPEAPLAADTPYAFAGVVPNAARGTRLRLEYTDPSSPTRQPVVVHLLTDARGRFADTHAFPTDGGSV